MQSAVRSPRLNERVWISLDGSLDNNYPSRVETVEGDRVVVAAPLIVEGHGDASGIVVAPTPHPDFSVVLLWKAATGFAKVDCRIEQVTEGKLTLWTLVPVEEVETIQRRQFVRVPDNSLVQLHFASNSVQALLVDLSEGGLCAVIPDFPLDVADIHIYADLTIGGQQILVPCKFVRKETNEMGQTTIAVAFIKVEDNQAEIIRRHVFGQQILLKKTGAL